MDDQSLWKKELSFGHKPNDEKDGDESPAGDEPRADAVEGDVAADAPEEAVWTKEVSFSRTPEAEPATVESAHETPVAEEEPVSDEPEVAEETVWKKEISLGRAASSEDESMEAEPIVTEGTVPTEALSYADPEPAAELQLQGAFVGDPGGDGGLVERLAVQRQPLLTTTAIGGTDLRRHDDVGVQLGVFLSRHAVVVDHRGQPVGVDLHDPVGALAGERAVRS